MQNTRALVKFTALAIAIINFSACDLLSGTNSEEKRNEVESDKQRSTAKDFPETKRPMPSKVEKEKRKDDTIPEGYASGYDFVDNRASALLYREGGLIIPCGDPGFAKYIDGGWKNPWILNQQIKVEKEHLSKNAPQISQEGTYPAARFSGRGGSLIFPVYWSKTGIGADSKQGLVIHLLMFNRVKGQHMTPMVNGTTLKSVKLQKGVNLVKVPVENYLVKRGDNILRLVFSKSIVERGVPSMGSIIVGRGRRQQATNSRSAAALFAVGIGGKDFTLPPDDKALASPFQELSQEKPSKQKLVLNKREKMSFFVLPPQNSRVVFEYKVAAAHTNEKKSDVRLMITAQTDDDETKTILTTKAGKDLHRKVVDISPFAGKATRLDFISLDGAVDLRNMTIHAKPPRRTLTWEKKDIDFVFIWIADTLRRDKVGAYGVKDAHTPNFDLFARRSVVFEEATIQGNHSMTSHGSLLTGLYPPVHGFEKAKRRVSSPLLYEYLHKTGWITSVFSSNGYVSTKWGFNRGLHKYRNFIRESKANASRYLWGTAKRFLKRNLEKKVFSYLATIDPHATYDPPGDLLKLHYPEPYKGPVPRRATGLFLEKVIKGVVKMDDPKDRKRLEALYKGEVSYNDKWFGNFLKDIEEMGIADRSLIVMVADHGDQFWEHGSVGHGTSLYEEEIAVPMMIWWPGLPKKEIRIEGDVEAMDIYATILDLLGLLEQAPSQSESLLERIRGKKPTVMPAAFAFNYAKSRSVKMGRYKLIIKRSEDLSLFDLGKDPTEQKNVFAQNTIALRLLRNTFSIKNAYLPQWTKSEWGWSSNLKPEFYEALKKEDGHLWGPKG